MQHVTPHEQRVVMENAQAMNSMQHAPQPRPSDPQHAFDRLIGGRVNEQQLQGGVNHHHA